MSNMRCDKPTPRVGFAQLKNFIGKSVLFAGKVESIDNGLVVLQAPDGSRVHIQATSHFDAPFVEVLGTVVDPQTIREESHVNYGDSFGGCFLRGQSTAGSCWELACVARATASDHAAVA